MKLSSAQIAAVEQATGANPIPDEDPANAKLREAVGEHTFYVDQQGLLVLESPEAAATPQETLQGTPDEALEIVRVGRWVEGEQQQLALTPPERTGQVIDLAAHRPAPKPDGPDAA